MDPADTDPLRKATATQGAGQHDKIIRGLTTSVNHLSGQRDQITTNLPGSFTSTAPPSAGGSSTAPPAQHMPAPHEPFMPIPEQYSGDLGSCGHFLLQCSLIFTQQPSIYSTDKSNISFVMNLLIGKAAQWAASLWESSSSVCNSFSLFMSEIKRVFDHPVQGKEAANPASNPHSGLTVSC